MKKTGLVEVVSGKLDISKKDAEKVVDAVFDSIVEALEGGEEEVDITKVIRFTVDEKSARKARNPKTGEEVDVPAKKVIKTKLLKKFKEAQV